MLTQVTGDSHWTERSIHRATTIEDDWGIQGGILKTFSRPVFAIRLAQMWRKTRAVFRSERKRERGIRPSVCLYAGPVCHPRGRDGLGGPRGQFISNHSLFCGYLGGSQLQLHRRQQLVPNGDRGLLGQWFKCLQYPGGSGGPLDHLLFLPPVLGTVEALWRTDRFVTLDNLLSNITTVSSFFWRLIFWFLFAIPGYEIWLYNLWCIILRSLGLEMHFTTTLVFDSGFYSDAVSFPVLMEIFAKHKTSSVFLKVEFGFKKN